MQPLQYKPDESIGDLIGDLTDEARTLIRQEIELAKLELKQTARHMGAGAGMIGAGAVFGHAALLSFGAMLIALLSTFMQVWLSALIVAVLFGVVAMILARKGQDTIKRESVTPKETIQTVREDVIWLKKRV